MNRLVLFLFLLFLVLASSQVLADRYADIEIKAQADGTLTIEGTTNCDSLINFDSKDFLSQKGNYWILNISSDELFSDAIYKITLPEDVVINYLRIPDLLTIDNKNNRMTILGAAHNQKLNLLVQYTAEKKNGKLWIVLVLLLFIIIGVVAKKVLKLSKKKTFIYQGLSPRQKLILKIVVKNPKGISQAELENITKLPKSSLSRNVDALVKKDLIHKEQSGMSNKLFLKK